MAVVMGIYNLLVNSVLVQTSKGYIYFELYFSHLSALNRTKAENKQSYVHIVVMPPILFSILFSD
jgi:hypothetical protein